MGDMEIPDELIDQLLGEYQGREQLTVRGFKIPVRWAAPVGCAGSKCSRAHANTRSH